MPAHDQSHDLDDSRDRSGHPPAGLSRNSWGSLFSFCARDASNRVKPNQNSFIFQMLTALQAKKRRDNVVKRPYPVSVAFSFPSVANELNLAFKRSPGYLEEIYGISSTSTYGSLSMHVSPRIFCT